MSRKYVFPVVFAIAFGLLFVWVASVLNPGVKWRHGHSDEGGFSYSLPGTPEKSGNTLTGREGAVEYSIRFEDYPPGQLMASSNQTLNALRDEFVKSVGGTTVEKDVERGRQIKDADPIRGLYLKVHVPDERIAETEIYLRDGGGAGQKPARLYRCLAVYPKSSRPRASLFFSAFRLDDELRD